MLTDKTLCAIHLIQISAGDRVIQSSNQGQMSGWATNTGFCLYKGAHFLIGPGLKQLYNTHLDGLKN